MVSPVRMIVESAYLYPTVFSRKAERLNPLMGCNVSLCHEASGSLPRAKQTRRLSERAARRASSGASDRCGDALANPKGS